MSSVKSVAVFNEVPWTGGLVKRRYDVVLTDNNLVDHSFVVGPVKVLPADDGSSVANDQLQQQKDTELGNQNIVPSWNNTQADYDRRSLGRAMTILDVDDFISYLALFQAMESRSGANAGQRAATLGVSTANYNQMDSRFSNTDAGRATVERSGSFAAMGAAAYYKNIADAVFTGKPNPPVDGDYVIISDVHNHAEGSSISPAPATDIRIAYVSVDDTDCTVFKKGAREVNTGGRTMGTGDAHLYSFMGVEFAIGGNLEFGSINDDGQRIYAKNANFRAETTNAIAFNFKDGAYRFDNCEFVWDHSAILRASNIGGHGFLEFNECTFSGDSINLCNLTDGAYGIFANCDMSGMATPAVAAWLFSGNQNKLGYGNCIDFYNCKFPSDLTNFLQGVTAANGAKDRVRVFSSTDFNDSNSNNNPQMTYFYGGVGSFEIDKSEYLNATLPDGSGFSFQMSSHAYGMQAETLDMPLMRLVNQDMTVEKTLTVEFISAATLTDKDFWIKVRYPQETLQALVTADSGENAELYPLDSGGTEHTASVAAWNVGTGNKYKYSVTIPAQPSGNTKAVIEVSAHLRKQSTDVNIDPTITVT